MIPLSHGLILSSLLFVIGMLILVVRRNFLFMLIGLEIMMNAAALSFVLVGNYWNNFYGQIMYIFIITVAAVEVSISLVLLLQLYKLNQTLNIDMLSEIKR